MDQAELHEERPGDRILAVGYDLDEPERPIEGDRLFHRRQRVEPQTGIAERARLTDHGPGQAPPEARAPRRRTNVKPLHLAGAVADRPQRDAARELGAGGGEEEPSGGRRVRPGQSGQLLLETLETEIDAHRGLVFAEEPARELDR